MENKFKIENYLREKELTKKKLESMKEKLLYEYIKAHGRTKKKSVLKDIITLIETSYCFFEDIAIDWSGIASVPNITMSSEEKRKSFERAVMMQRNTFLKMSEAAVKDFLESNLDFYGDYSVNTRRINPEELEDIVLSFLQDYDENFYLKYNDKLRKGEIFSAMISDAGGMTCPFGTINNNFIFIQDYYRDTLQFGSILVHELAHSFEFDLNYSVGNKNVNERLFTTPFYEVSSSFFEYAFLRYLKENKIHEDIADSLLNEYYIEAFIKILEMNILCRHQNFIYDELGRVILNDMEVMRDVEDVKEKLNYYELPELGDTLSLTNSFVYGVGGLFSIYLYDNYKKEPEAFKKEFSNALLSYGIIKDISAFEKVGITPDELEKSGSLRRILTREY